MSVLLFIFLTSDGGPQADFELEPKPHHPTSRISMSRVPVTLTSIDYYCAWDFFIE
jgi:hypothetical protein